MYRASNPDIDYCKTSENEGRTCNEIYVPLVEIVRGVAARYAASGGVHLAAMLPPFSLNQTFQPARSNPHAADAAAN